MKAIFIPFAAVWLLASPLGAALTSAPSPTATLLYVAPGGSDDNPGTLQQPFATLEKAQHAVRERIKAARRAVRVLLRGGTYYLDRPLILTPEDSTAESPVTYAASPGERVTLSGGRRLDCNWRPYQSGIVMCDLPEVKAGKLAFTQLFVNGKRQVRGAVSELRQLAPGQERLHLSGRHHTGGYGRSAAGSQR